MNTFRQRAGASLLLGALAACSGPPKPKEELVEWNTEEYAAWDAGVETEQAPSLLTASEACEAFRRRLQEGCDWTERFPPEFSGDICEISLEQWFDPSTPDHQRLQSLASCWKLGCSAAASCMTQQTPQTPRPPRACGEEGTGPVLVSAERWENRVFSNVDRFSEANTSVEQPVEVCGIQGEVEWMSRARCDDGSSPYASPAEINTRRDSWVQRGGACNSILDRYSVACPEKTYVIHVDRYVCPE